MDLTAETFSILLLLMPGFISSLILNTIVVRKSKGNFSRVIEALVFSFLIYAILSPFVDITPFKFEIGPRGSKTHVLIDSGLVYTLLLSVLLPLGLGAALTHDLHMKFLRKCKITKRTARSTTWLDVFLDQERYVIVSLADGRRIFGWPQYYSDDLEEGALYLYDPSWVDDDGNYIEMEGVHGMFLVKKELIEHILFTDLDRKKIQKEEGQDANGEN